jgi:hypothetical protein
VEEAEWLRGLICLFRDLEVPLDVDVEDGTRRSRGARVGIERITRGETRGCGWEGQVSSSPYSVRAELSDIHCEKNEINTQDPRLTFLRPVETCPRISAKVLRCLLKRGRRNSLSCSLLMLSASIPLCTHKSGAINISHERSGHEFAVTPV